MYKIALFSNVNIEPIKGLLNAQYEVFLPQGYGTVIEELLNRESEYAKSNVQAVFILIDIVELCKNCNTIEEIEQEISNWFSNIERALNDDSRYYIGDVDARTSAFDINCQNYSAYEVEKRWRDKLNELSMRYRNVQLFAYKKLAEDMGKAQFYSQKLWYLGRIIHSQEARTVIADQIKKSIEQWQEEKSFPKKVLLLDLDNTLWGGILGEGGITLSDEKTGLIYKELQRMILKIKNTGIILGVVSKNNYDEALEMIEKCPHMILKKNDFSILKINWNNKNENILEIAQELNLSTDSFVFFDDSEQERELIKMTLPEVSVPEFPKDIELLPDKMIEIFERYFRKDIYTKEDMERTELYLANYKRKEEQAAAQSFEEYIDNLKIEINRVANVPNCERLFQLVNKTNQFNLTTKRYTYEELKTILESSEYDVYMFEVKDKFGNNGITSAVIVNLTTEVEIDSFIMSCRIMGRKIEFTILNYVERELLRTGCGKIKAQYIQTKKNQVVSDFYEKAGYEIIRCADGTKIYERTLNISDLT